MFKEAGFSKGTTYYELLNFITHRPNDWLDNWWNPNRVIIIDEVQMSYGYGSLWNDFIKTVSCDPLEEGPMIILFSSYGSPSKKPLITPTPIQFSSRQRLSIRSLYSNNQCFIVLRARGIRWCSSSIWWVLQQGWSALSSHPRTYWIHMGACGWTSGCHYIPHFGAS